MDMALSACSQEQELSDKIHLLSRANRTVKHPQAGVASRPLISVLPWLMRVQAFLLTTLLSLPHSYSPPGFSLCLGPCAMTGST
jgi:hypothetical protein